MTDEGALTALRRSGELKGASGPTLDRLARRMTRREFPRGRVIFWEGDPPGPAFLVEEGHIWLTSRRLDGTMQFVADMGPGSLVGEHTALAGRRRTVTATPHSGVVAWEIPVEALREAIRSDNALAYDMLMAAVDILLEKDIELVLLSGMSTKQRLAYVLVELERSSPLEGIRVSHSELAMMIAAARESVTRALRELREAGLIRTRGRAIEIVDRDRLRALYDPVAGRM